MRRCNHLVCYSGFLAVFGATKSHFRLGLCTARGYREMMKQRFARKKRLSVKQYPKKSDRPIPRNKKRI